MRNFSMAMLQAIRLYGFTAILDFAVRISNRDDIVNALLPQLPSLASTAMLEVSNTRASLKAGEGEYANPIPASELIILAK